MSNISLNLVTDHQYLGICLHHKLPWGSLVERIRYKVIHLLGFLKPNLYNAPTQVKEHIYKELLLVLLSYLDPHHRKDKYKLEMIQNFAACFVLNKLWHRQQKNDSITDMLTYLKWSSLEDQRKVSFLMLLFKIVRKFYIVPGCCLPELASAPLESTCAHHSLRLACIQSIIDTYKDSFLPRTYHYIE